MADWPSKKVQVLRGIHAQWKKDFTKTHGRPPTSGESFNKTLYSEHPFESALERTRRLNKEHNEAMGKTENVMNREKAMEVPTTLKKQRFK